MAANDPERVFTPALLAFLLAVVGVIAWSVATRYPAPDLEGCVELLGDGDLDRDERERILLRTVDLAGESGPRGRLVGCLAALALGKASRFAGLRGALEEARGLSAERLRWLDLGDPLLANVLRASRLEGRDAGAADAAWSQVAQQARMVGNALARELAAAALERGR